MISVLTSEARANLVSVILGASSTIVVPQYLELGELAGSVLATDETTNGPLYPRIPCAVSYTTIDTTNDTFRCSTIYSPTSAQSISNLALFDVSTSAPTGTVARQVNYGDLQVQILGYGNFPAFPFDVQIQSEVMTVVSGNGSNVWYVVRAVNGSALTLNSIAAGTQIVGGNGTTNGNMFLKSSFGPLTLDPGTTIEFIIDLQFQ